MSRGEIGAGGDEMRRANKGVGRGVNKKRQTFQRLSLPDCCVCACVGGNLKVNVEIFHPLTH